MQAACGTVANRRVS